MNVLLNVYFCDLGKNSVPLLPKGTIKCMYTPGVIANLPRTPTKINKNSTITKVKILVEQVIL